MTKHKTYGGSTSIRIETVEQLHEFLNDSTPEQIFSKFDDRVESIYNQYVKICHPDMTDHPLAAATFKLLMQKKNDRLGADTVRITTKKGVYYEVGANPNYKGDISNLYVTKDETHILKIGGSDSTGFLNNAKSVLSDIVGKDKSMDMYFPHIKDTFQIDGNYCQVITNDNALFSLAQIKAKYPNLETRHFAWMFKRLLVALAWTHKQGYVHNAVLAEHFLVNRDTHGGRLIGWSHAIKAGEVAKTIPNGKRPHYPKEVIDKTPSSPYNDVYMAGKLGEWMLGDNLGEVPRIKTYLSSFYLPKKTAISNAWELHKILDEILFTTFGKPKFHPLHI